MNPQFLGRSYTRYLAGDMLNRAGFTGASKIPGAVQFASGARKLALASGELKGGMESLS